MIRHHLNLLRALLLLADGVAAAILFVVVSQVRLGPSWQQAWDHAGGPWWAWALGYGLLWMGAEWLHELDQLRARWTFRREALDIAQAAVLMLVGVFSLLFLIHAPDVSRLFLVSLFVAQVAFSIVQRRLFRTGLVVTRTLSIGTRRILVLGTSARARRLATQLEQHPALAYRVVGHLGRPSRSCPSVIGPIEDIERIVHGDAVDEILAVFEPDELVYLEPVVALAQQEGKRLRLVLVPGLAPVAGGRVEMVDREEVLTITNGPDRLLALGTKRLVDIVMGLGVLLVLAPVLLVIATAIRLEDGGPVFFRQTRVGLNGRGFRIIKFRTMVPDAEARLAEVASLNEIDGPAFKIDDDPRITRVGRLLRRTSFDEFPQFWNVVRGEMSIVGPRPPIPGEVDDYDLWHRRRLSMKPGITGLWQVSARLETEFDRWVELDLRYIDRWSLWLDFKIMVRTVPAMLAGR